jgi:hypothetical protein
MKPFKRCSNQWSAISRTKPTSKTAAGTQNWLSVRIALVLDDPKVRTSRSRAAHREADPRPAAGLSRIQATGKNRFRRRARHDGFYLNMA